jgi:hypothetical protein
MYAMTAATSSPKIAIPHSVSRFVAIPDCWCTVAIMVSPVRAGPESAAEDMAGFARHVYTDLHDISRRLADLELVLTRFSDMLDIYEPVMRRYASMTGMRGMGRGRRRGGQEGAAGG